MGRKGGGEAGTSGVGGALGTVGEKRVEAMSISADQGGPGARRRVGDRFMVHATITAVEQVSRSMRRIRLDTGGMVAGGADTGGAEAAALAEAAGAEAGAAAAGAGAGKVLEALPGQQIRIQVGSSAGAVDWLVGQLRTYSVWEVGAGYLDVVVLDHGDGPGAVWGRRAEVGQSVRFLRPQGDFVLRGGAAQHVFIGEETASVPFGAMLRALALRADQQGLAIVEVDDPADRIALPGTVNWHYRHGASAVGSASLVEAVRVAELPAAGSAVAYVAGEARAVQMVRGHLVEERGWARRDVVTKPFWAPGKKGLE